MSSIKNIFTSILVLFSLFLTYGCSRKHSNPKPPVVEENSSIQKIALIVGVSDYAGEANDLKGIDLDVSKAKQLFTKWGFTIDKLQNSLDFEQKMQTYAQKLKPEDVFILYYSGHGSSAPDNSHDEADGRDEYIVLSDSKKNYFLIDDKINLLLNNINARKLIIFDSCNSGTTYKILHQALPSDTQVKYIPAPKTLRDTTGENANIPNTTLEGSFIYFGACLDYEQSLASSQGSLFTNVFTQKADLSKSAKTIHEETLESLSEYFHPQLHASDEVLKNIPLKSYLKIK